LDRLRHRRQSPFELSASPDEPRPPKPSHPSQKQSPTTKTLLDATQSLLENERLWTGTRLGSGGRAGACAIDANTAENVGVSRAVILADGIPELIAREGKAANKL